MQFFGLLQKILNVLEGFHREVELPPITIPQQCQGLQVKLPMTSLVQLPSEDFRENNIQ